MKEGTKSSKKGKRQFTVQQMANVIPYRAANMGYEETIEWVREHSDLGLRGSKQLVDDVLSCKYEHKRFTS